jgi:hypothetical protein
LTLFKFRKLLKGRKIRSATRIESSEGSAVYMITIEGDGNTINVPEPVYRLATDRKVAKAEKGIVEPLLSGGIDVLEVRSEGKEIERIGKDEGAYFGVVDDQEDLDAPSQTVQAILELRSPVFAQGEKWQFNYGEQRISAEITDPRFVTRVFTYGDRFGVGDKFKVTLRISQYQTKSGSIRNSYEVERVLEQWEAKEQRPLPLDPSEPN